MRALRAPWTVLVVCGGVAGCTALLGIEERKLRPVGVDGGGSGGTAAGDGTAGLGGDGSSDSGAGAAGRVDGGGAGAAGGAGGTGAGGTVGGSGGSSGGAGGAPAPCSSDPCTGCLCTSCAADWAKCTGSGVDCKTAAICASGTCGGPCPQSCSDPSLRPFVDALKTCLISPAGAGCMGPCTGGGSGGATGAGGITGAGGAMGTTEVCDFVDNDGDGSVDNGFTWTTLGGGPLTVPSVSGFTGAIVGASSATGALFAGASSSPPGIWVAGFPTGAPQPVVQTFPIAAPVLGVRIAARPDVPGRFGVLVAVGDPTCASSAAGCQYWFGMADGTTGAVNLNALPPMPGMGVTDVFGLVAAGGGGQFAAVVGKTPGGGVTFVKVGPGSMNPTTAINTSSFGSAGTMVSLDPIAATSLWLGPSAPPGSVIAQMFSGPNPQGPPMPYPTCGAPATRVVASTLRNSRGLVSVAWGCSSAGTTLGTAPSSGTGPVTQGTVVDTSSTPLGLVSVDVGGVLAITSGAEMHLVRLRSDGKTDGTPTIVLPIPAGTSGSVAVASDGKRLVFVLATGGGTPLTFIPVGCQ